MMRPYGKGLKVYLHREPIEARNGLAAIAQEVIEVAPFSGALLIFVSKSYHAVKILYRHRNGFVLWHKMIESQEKFCWPRLIDQEVVTLTAEELEWLLEGFDIFRQPHKWPGRPRASESRKISTMDSWCLMRA
jgi:transposase